MNDLPITTLFMLMSADGKISTGSVDERDFDKDLPNVAGTCEGLSQYYELETKTDYYSFNTGKVMAKVGWNDQKEDIQKIDVIFVLVDNKPHLTERGITNLLKRTSKVYIVTTNAQHPAYEINDEHLSVIGYKDKIDFKDLFAKVKTFGGERVTIQSGGEMNAELMRAGLINFVSLVVAPVMVGGRDTASLLGGRSLETDDDLRLLKPLELISVDKLNGSYLHLKYKVIQ